MRIDEARQCHSPGGVESLRATRRRMSLNLSAGADRGDEAVCDEHCAIFYEPDIGKPGAATVPAATQS